MTELLCLPTTKAWLHNCGRLGHHVKYSNAMILTDITVPWNFAEFHKLSCAIWQNLPQKKWFQSPWLLLGVHWVVINVDVVRCGSITTVYLCALTQRDTEWAQYVCFECCEFQVVFGVSVCTVTLSEHSMCVLSAVSSKLCFLTVCCKYDSIDSATHAKNSLQGQDIYSGCCTIKAEYAKVCTTESEWESSLTLIRMSAPRLTELLSYVYSCTGCQFVNEFLPHYATQSTVLLRQVVYLSVCL